MNTGFDTKHMIEVLKNTDCPPLELSVVERTPHIHDLTSKTWGCDYAINSKNEDGTIIRMTVWCPKTIVVGDYLIIRNGPGTTRYRADEVKPTGDPKDMYFIVASFAPRKAPAG